MPSPKRTTAPKPPDSTVRVEAPVDLAVMLERHLGPVAAPRQPGEFSVHELAAVRRVSGKRAHAILYNLLSQGIVTRRQGRKNQYLYRFVE